MRLLRSLHYEVQANDLGTFAFVVGTLFVVALLASYIPARRATKVDLGGAALRVRAQTLVCGRTFGGFKDEERRRYPQTQVCATSAL